LHFRVQSLMLYIYYFLSKIKKKLLVSPKKNRN
jgi:hypothetical protein